MLIRKNELNLSKSKYCKGVQCPKMLWLEKNKYNEAIDKSSELVLENGTKVGELARGLLVYCKLDTYAMVKVWEKLKEIIE